MVRPKVHDEALRVRLLERAGATLSAGGLTGLSLRTLARDCGTSTTAVYSLFGGKPGLLAALLDEAFRRFGEHLGAVPRGLDPVDDLVQLGLAYRRCALTEPHVFDVMFGGDPHPAVALTAHEALRGLVERAVEDKSLRPDLDPVTAALTLWAAVHGWVTLERRGVLPGQADGRFEDALLAVLRGWRPAGSWSRHPDG
jgi:AcrR family transcriptional regulator